MSKLAHPRHPPPPLTHSHTQIPPTSSQSHTGYEPPLLRTSSYSGPTARFSLSREPPSVAMSDDLRLRSAHAHAWVALFAVRKAPGESYCDMFRSIEDAYNKVVRVTSPDLDPLPNSNSTRSLSPLPPPSPPRWCCQRSYHKTHRRLSFWLWGVVIVEQAATPNANSSNAAAAST